MRAAALWGVAPTVYLEQWSARDRGLAEAHLLERDGRCGTCGNQAALCHHPATQGQWDVIEDVCYATEALAEAADDDGEPEPGLMRYAVLKADFAPPRLSVLREGLQTTHDKDRGITR